MRIFFRLWMVATLFWAGVCFLLLPHGPDMGPAYAFAILVPSLGILLLGAGIAW